MPFSVRLASAIEGFTYIVGTLGSFKEKPCLLGGPMPSARLIDHVGPVSREISSIPVAFFAKLFRVSV